MTDKLDIYDLLGVVVPGTLTVLLAMVLFPALPARVAAMKLPDGFVVVGWVALSVFAGHVVQAVASLAEPILHWSWGGSPAERALSKGLGKRYLPTDAAGRLRGKLVAAVGADASDTSLFHFAMQRTEGSGRGARFNYLYAYHRTLCILSVIATIILPVVAHRSSSWTVVLQVAVFAVLVSVLMWHRAKQRSFYYVREVLLTAERLLDERSQGSALPLPGEKA